MSKKILAGVVLLLAAVASRAASFTTLNDPGLFLSDAYGVSADGTTVVGRANTGGGVMQAFRWTPSGGLQLLGDLPGNITSSGAFGVSADGSVVVGTGVSVNGHEAFRWTAATGMVGLGFRPGSNTSFGYAVSADGSVVVGESGSEAARWTAATGMVGLGQLPGGVEGTATAISADGTIIAGQSGSGLGRYPFTWTASTGLVSLGTVSGQCPNGFADAISADGTTIVGHLYCDSLPSFRWTATSGMVALGTVSTFNALATSGDGSIVVGGGGVDPFIWTQADGAQLLLDVLIARGATGLEGWTLNYARAISPDGRWVVGQAYGQAPGEEYATNHAFIADLMPVPVPAAGWLLAAALGVLGGLRRLTLADVPSLHLRSVTDLHLQQDSAATS